MAYTRDDLTTDILPHFLDVRFTYFSVWGNGKHMLGTTLSTLDVTTRRRILAPLALLDRAQQFADAADVLVRQDELSSQTRSVLDGMEKLRRELEGSNHLFVIYFLYGRSIELALKAFLSCHGKTEGDLRSVSHSLTGCLAEAERLGLASGFPLTDAHRTAIHWISDPYAGKDFEYAKVTSGGARISEMPDVPWVRWVASSFIRGLRAVCVRSTLYLPPSRK